jgi:outer membrane protein TolC
MGMWTALLAGFLIGQALPFDEALGLARALPLVEAEQRAKSARAELAEDSSLLLENPLLQLQPGARRAANGGTAPEVYLAINQRIPLTSAGSKRRRTLAREVDHDAALAGVSLRDARRRIAEAWLSRWLTDQAREVSRREVALADELVRLLTSTLQAGEATLVDVATARAWRAEAQLSELAMEGQSFETGVLLARAVGAEDGEPRTTSGDLPAIALPDHALLRSHAPKVDETVQVREAHAAHESEVARLSEIEAVKGPSFGIGAMAWREGTGDLAAVATLEVQVPLFERGERERAVQAASAERARGREQDSILEQRAERVRLLHDLQHTDAVVLALQTGLLRAANQLADAQHRRFQAREATAQDWVIARRAVLSADIALIKARAAQVLARFLVAESFDARGP